MWPVDDDIGNLPALLLRALESPGRNTPSKPYGIRATQLLDPPRIQILQRRHGGQIRLTASSLIPSFIGRAIHALIEEEAKLNGIDFRSEERLYVSILGTVVSGQIDLQVLEDDKVVLLDWKYTNAVFVYLHLKQWEEQLNIYAYLYFCTYDHDPVELVIIALYRDWSQFEASKREGKTAYPQAPVEKFVIPLWPLEERKRFIEDRIRLHREALVDSDLDDELPLCSPEDRWMRQKFYVKSLQAKRALKVAGTREEAEQYIAQSRNPKSLKIVEQPAEPRRCQGNWCHVAEWCEQYQSELRKDSNEQSDAGDESGLAE